MGVIAEMNGYDFGFVVFSALPFPSFLVSLLRSAREQQRQLNLILNLGKSKMM
jgi:hypothetical protein